MYIKRIHLTNYGPIDRLDIASPFDGDKPKPMLLVGENGSGKSIVLSHIVNALLFSQQVAYPQTPEVQKDKVYKLRTPSYVTSGRALSFSRVEFENDICVEELQLARTRKTYDAVPPEIDELGARKLWKRLTPSESSAFLPRFDEAQIRDLFSKNCVLYLPANRFEDPAWMNVQNLKATAQHMSLTHLQGHTDRAILSYSPLRDNENWLFDVVYDFSVFEQRTQRVNIPVESSGKSKLTVPLPVFAGFSGRAKSLYDVALSVVRAVVRGSNVRFGIGQRSHRVVSVESDGQRVPNIFQLSSGEVSLLNMFLSILRDFDLCGAPFTRREDLRGIVVVDEVDLHLHAVHQYEILPKLMQMFPRVQFIVTTHSPLVVLGLQGTLGDKAFALYQMPNGREIGSEEFREFGEAYEVFRNTNTHLADLEIAVSEAQKPVVFVDGTTDVKYIARARELLNWDDSVHEFEVRNGGGDSNLRKAWGTLTQMAVVERSVVLLHDCDSSTQPRASGNVFRRRVGRIAGHPIRTGIENLFSKATLERARAHKPAFIDVESEHQSTKRGQPQTIPEKWEIHPDEKSNLCGWLCENGTEEDFHCFDRILDGLRDIPGIARQGDAPNGDEESDLVLTEDEDRERASGGQDGESS